MDAEPITPQQFHDEDGNEDWRVLAWGAHAFFRAGSYSAGARFVAAVVDLAAALGSEPDLDLRHEGVAVKLITRELRTLSTHDIELARRISAAAHEHGLVADPSALQVVQTAIASVPSADIAPFWRAALGYVPVGDAHLVDPLRRNSPLFLQNELDEGKPRRGRFHVDVSVPHDLLHERISAVIAAGGRLVSDEDAPHWWTLADSENHGLDITTWWGRDRLRLEERD